MTTQITTLLNYLFEYQASLHHRTELLESLDWDESALEVLFDIVVFELSYLVNLGTSDELKTTVVLAVLREKLKGRATTNQIDMIMELLHSEVAMINSNKENVCD